MNTSGLFNLFRYQRIGLISPDREWMLFSECRGSWLLESEEAFEKHLKKLIEAKNDQEAKRVF